MNIETLLRLRFQFEVLFKGKFVIVEKKCGSMRNRSIKGMRKYGKQEGKGLEEENIYTSLSWEPRATMPCYNSHLIVIDDCRIQHSRKVEVIVETEKSICCDHVVCNNRISPIMWLSMSQKKKQ